MSEETFGSSSRRPPEFYPPQPSAQSTEVKSEYQDDQDQSSYLAHHQPYYTPHEQQPQAAASTSYDQLDWSRYSGQEFQDHPLGAQQAYETSTGYDEGQPSHYYQHQRGSYQPDSLQLSFGQPDLPPPRLGTEPVSESKGRRIIFRDGPLAGKFVRFSLEVFQHPAHGRAFNELRDRRTLQPIAIAAIRCWQCFSRLEGMYDMIDELPSLLEDDMLWEEVEMGVEDIDPSQFICSVTLLQTSSDTTPSDASSNSPAGESTPGSTPRSLLSPAQTAGFSPANSLLEQSPLSSMSGRRELTTADDMRSSKRRRFSLSPRLPSPQQMMGPLSIDTQVPPVVSRTRNLHGRVHVNGRKMSVPETADGDGKLRIWFVFPDVSIKYEGRYRLHFRVFQLATSSASMALQVGSMGPPAPPSGTLVCEGMSDSIEVINSRSGILPASINKLTEYLTR